MHEGVDRLDMWIAIRGMINQKKPSCGYRELWIGEMREANRVGFFCCYIRTGVYAVSERIGSNAA